MGRLLIRDAWYHELASDALYEVEFERALLQRTPLLFPGFTAVGFKKTVYSPDGPAQADYALIDNDFREWWVVEVELAHHSFSGHVLPQVRVLSTAAYGPDIAEYLATRNPALDARRLPDLLKGAQPGVLVVVNLDKPDWEGPLQAIGARLVRFQIYRSAQNEHAFHFDGNIPSVGDSIISKCRVDRNLPWMLTVSSPGSLAIGRNQRLDLVHEGQIGPWSRIDSSDTVWLMPECAVRLVPGADYVLRRDTLGVIYLERR